MKKILCLDFDGVICDSIEETLLVSYNAYLEKNNTSLGLVRNVAEIPDLIQEQFREYRYLVGPAKEYYALMKAIHNSAGNEIPGQFQSICRTEESALHSFSDHFFHVRKEFRHNDLDAWLRLHSIFTEFSDHWEVLKPSYEIYIVTTKDHESVVMLLSNNGIEIADNHIYTKDRFSMKSGAIKNIMKIMHCGNSDVIFVDDNENHLKNVSDVGVQCLLATWGYTGPISGKFKAVWSMVDLIDDSKGDNL